MRIALINSGIGLLAAAAALHRLRPDADLILATDPDGMPWGPRTPADICARALLCARSTVRYQPDVLVMACNTGSVHALDAMRAEFEPGIPVIGTVPAIKPAAAAHRHVAIWATVATTASAYQQRLIADFGGSAEVTAVACPSLADAIDAGDVPTAAAAVAAAAARTPPGCEAVVLGCTEYELAAAQIRAAVPGAVTFGSAAAVAAQALRRIPPIQPPAPHAGGHHGAQPADPHADGHDRAQPPDGHHGAQPADSHAGGRRGLPRVGTPKGTVRVLLSGRPSALPAAAFQYPEGRMLSSLVVADDHEPAPGTAITR